MRAFAQRRLIARGEMVTLMGRNGMGKTTTVRSIMGLTPAMAGAIRFAGHDIRDLPAYRVAQLGIGLVPEGRQVFPTLTARENLVATAANRGNVADPWTYERICALFPSLERRAHVMARQLSGGEQQMLAIGRALMGLPRMLMLDEPSLGLAPLVVRDIFGVLRAINEQGVTIVLVEQNARMALQLANRGYILEQGRVVGAGTGAELLADVGVQRAYLGYVGAT